MVEWITLWGSKLRHYCLAGVEADIEHLRREVAAQRVALRDPEALRSLLTTAVQAEAARSAEQMAATLRPLIDAVLRQRTRELRRRRGAVAGMGIAAIAGLLWWRQPDLHAVAVAFITARPALDDSGRNTVTLAPPSDAARQEASLVLEERTDGFGLSQAVQSDSDLAAAVRLRLGRCPDLAGTQVSFSVKDGWVWLRGDAGAAGREAAADALAELGSGVLVVNQIRVKRPQVLAER